MARARTLWMVALVVPPCWGVAQTAYAATLPRAIPYTEAICSSDPNVVFCEDFQGNDIVNRSRGGFGSCESTWGNPAISASDFCRGSGGSVQINTVARPYFAPDKRVWRVAIGPPGVADITTGVDTGIGPGTIGGWLKPSQLVGLGACETFTVNSGAILPAPYNPGASVSGANCLDDFYVRFQFFLSQNYSYPTVLDQKLPFLNPLCQKLNTKCPDAPSSPWESGIYMSTNSWCGPRYFPPTGRSFADALVIRYGPDFRQFPYQNEYCPPLAPGAPVDGRRMPRTVVGRWYTVEYHVRLSTTASGVLEMWLDGNLAYRSHRPTTNAMSRPGYVFIMAWRNLAGCPCTGYVELDAVVISRARIGLPTPPSVSPTTPAVK